MSHVLLKVHVRITYAGDSLDTGQFNKSGKNSWTHQLNRPNKNGSS